MPKHIAVMLLAIFLPLSVSAVEVDSLDVDTVASRTVHRFAVDVIPAAILHTNHFLKGDNPEGRTMNHAFTAHLKYAFMPASGSWQSKVYKGVYQGVGVAATSFNKQLGAPVLAYIYQGARIATLSRRLTFNYEWNLGLAIGWKPYDMYENTANMVIGSKVTAYIDADFYLSWMLSRNLDLNIGLSATHYSNGNTKLPNTGLNTLGPRIGLAYYVGRPAQESHARQISAFERRMTYDLVLFGAWRRRGVYINDEPAYALASSFAVAGFNFTPMYNLNHWLNVGASLDGVYDHSANLDYDVLVAFDETQVPEYYTPKAARQMALGLSARVEFVMPYFVINVGVGKNVINGGGDFSGLYEILALKMNVTRRVFAHIGYSLNKFKEPNNLMLGMGYRFGKVRGR